MSRTKKNSNSASNPVKKYISFKGSKGQLTFYDKENPKADEKGNVYLDEITFTILDTKASISGFNESQSCGISSNLLNPFDLGKKELVVKTKIEGTFDTYAKGIYKEIKDKVFAIGGKFTTNVFALADVGDGLEIVRIDISGSALEPFIKLTNSLENREDMYDLVITMKKGALSVRKNSKTVKVTETEKKKVIAAIQKDPMYNKPTWFYVPQYETTEISTKLADEAGEADEVLQKYFDSFEENNSSDTENAPSEEVINDVEKLFKSDNTESADDLVDDDLPF